MQLNVNYFVNGVKSWFTFLPAKENQPKWAWLSQRASSVSLMLMFLFVLPLHFLRWKAQHAETSHTWLGMTHEMCANELSILAGALLAWCLMSWVSKPFFISLYEYRSKERTYLESRPDDQFARSLFRKNNNDQGRLFFLACGIFGSGVFLFVGFNGNEKENLISFMAFLWVIAALVAAAGLLSMLFISFAIPFSKKVTVFRQDASRRRFDALPGSAKEAFRIRASSLGVDMEDDSFMRAAVKEYNTRKRLAEQQAAQLETETPPSISDAPSRRL